MKLSVIASLAILISSGISFAQDSSGDPCEKALQRIQKDSHLKRAQLKPIARCQGVDPSFFPSIEPSDRIEKASICMLRGPDTLAFIGTHEGTTGKVELIESAKVHAKDTRQQLGEDETQIVMEKTGKYPGFMTEYDTITKFTYHKGKQPTLVYRYGESPSGLYGPLADYHYLYFTRINCRPL